MSDQHIEALIQSVNSVAAASGTTTFQTVIFPLITLIIGAFSAYLFSTRLYDISSDRERKSRIARELSQCICDLQNTSVEYWSKDYDSSKIDEIAISEAHIHAGLILLRSLSNQFTSQNMSVGERNEITTMLDEYFSDIYDCITDGEFETADRKASKKRVMDIVSLSIEVRANLSIYC